MNDPVHVDQVKKQFPTMIAAEMEAAAVAQVCHQFGTPFVVIRALSDIAGKESSVSFDEFLPVAATTFNRYCFTSHLEIVIEIVVR